MILLSLISYIIYIVAIFGPTLFFYDYVEGSRTYRLSSFRVYTCTALMVIFFFVTLAGLFVPCALVSKYIAEKPETRQRDLIVLGIDLILSIIFFIWSSVNIAKEKRKGKDYDPLPTLRISASTEIWCCLLIY